MIFIIFSKLGKGPFEGPGSTPWGPRRGTDVMAFLKVQCHHYGISIGEYPTSIIRRSLVVLMTRWRYPKGMVLLFSVVFFL